MIGTGREIYQAENAKELDVSASDYTVTDGRGFGTLYIGTTGKVKVKTIGGNTVTFTAFPAGAFIPVLVDKVFTSGTTASNIILMWN